jgi:Glycosyl hydrolase catalytic core
MPHVVLALGVSLAPLGACGTREQVDLPTSDPASATASTPPTDASLAVPSADGSAGPTPTATASTGDAQPPPANVAEAGTMAPEGGSPAPDAAGGASAPKRGIAYGYHSDADLTALSAGISWWYNWSPKPDGTLTQSYAALGVEFVPMIWGGNFDPVTLAKQVPAGAKYLLTFNEPEAAAQSNLTPAQAAALWPKVEAFAKSRNLQIVSPGVNYCGGNCNETSPFDWLDKFFAACAGCQVDYVALHWYACTKAALTSTLAQYEAKYKKPLWVTEFSCLDSTNITVAVEQQYMQDAVAALEADPMVFRYAWFTGRYTQQPPVNLLGAASGVLTPLGQKYVALPRGP